MINRYRYRRIVKNEMPLYKKMFKERGMKFVNQYTSPNFSYVNANQYSNLNIIQHVWSEGDRYYKLAEKYYGDPQDWWIIAKFNQKPTESHIQFGDIIKIPTPIELVLEYMLG